jgi:SAM-dependent methyltransferase
MGRRLNTAQGLRPKTRVGISTTVVKCLDCGLIYSDPLPIPENIEDHYGVPPEDYWHEEYFETRSFDESRLKQLAPHAKTFLDIGAGIGETMRSIKEMDVWGIEASKPFYDRAIELGVDPGRLIHSTFENAELSMTFDVVSFSVVLEHLYDPSASIRKALGWLNPGGIIYIEVPDSEYMLSKIFNLYFWLARTDYVVNISPMHVPFHLYEFTERSFRLNGQRQGYSIAHIDRYPGSAPIAPGISKLLSPLMNITKTGMGLIVYLKKS